MASGSVEADSGSVTAPVPEMSLQPLVTMTLVALAVALAAAIIAWGWPGLLGLPSPRGTAFVVAVGSASAVGTALATLDDPYLAWMPAALAGSIFVAFLHQLARRDGRPRLVESIASNITAIAIVVSGASLVALSRTPQGGLVVALASSAVALSALIDLAGVSQRLRPWLPPLVMLAGGLVAVVVGYLLGADSWGGAALLGVMAAGISHAVRRVLATLPAISSARSQLVSASASLLTGGVVVYVVGRLLIS